MSPNQQFIRNNVLAGLSSDDFDVIQAGLEPVKLDMHRMLIEPNQPIEHLYFPEAGFASITTGGNSSRIEIGIVGREGVVGVAVALGTDRTPFAVFMQSPGHGLRITTAPLEQAMADRPSLHRRMLRYAQALNVQTAATAFTNAEHTVEMRLARWLLMCRDRVEGDEFAFTHEFIAMMLGVRRPSVTTTIHALEGHGLIRAKRASIAVLDREGLEKLADDAYGLPEAEYERLMSGRQ